MRAKTVAWCSAIVLLVALLIAIPAFAQEAKDRIKDQIIGFDATPDAVITYPVSINSRGEITGYFNDNHGDHGFLRERDGTIITFDGPDAIHYTLGGGTIPSVINSEGDIAGSFMSLSGSHGFIRDRDGTFTTFDISHNPTSLSVAAMNSRDEIVGSYSDVQHGFIRDKNGRITLFDVFSSRTYPAGINSEGEITGSYFMSTGFGHAFVRAQNGKITTFDAPNANSSGTGPMGINDRGEIAGYYRDSGNMLHGFLRTRNGRLVSFDPTPLGGIPTSINSEGAITGWCYDDAGNGGFVRSPRGAIITFGAGFKGITPLSINAIGEITGYYYDIVSNNGTASIITHGFLRKADPYQWIRNEFPDRDGDRDHRN